MDEIKVLDHGFVRLIKKDGEDSSVVQAARVSYGSGTKSSREDQGLINYLMRNRHTSPFEMVGLTFHCKMPIFVARQWVRHRTASLNEYSARYSVLDKEFYIPAAENLARQSKDNKQGRSVDKFSTPEVIGIQDLIKRSSEKAYENYKVLLDIDVARELARMVLPVNFYTQWYWKMDLHNLFHFLKLRMDPHAQYEIRVYANVIAEIVKKEFPMCWKAFEEYQLNSKTFSGKEVITIGENLGSDEDEIENFTQDYSDGEWKEFVAKIGAA